jgi:four helix bundle protein
MKYQRFEDLPVWRTAIDLAVETYKLTATGDLRGLSSLRDQLERATLSVSNNIAEGFERGTNVELLTFLYIARGSAGEVRSMLRLLRLLGSLAHRESVISNLESLASSASRQLGAWIESLKNSDFKGSRSQNESTRSTTQEVDRREAFLQKLRQIQEKGMDCPPPPSEPTPAD